MGPYLAIYRLGGNDLIGLEGTETAMYSVSESRMAIPAR